MKIAPSILSCDFLHLADELHRLESAGAKMIHLDVMDGHFVPNLTFGFPVIRRIREFTGLPLDVHLMVTNPEVYVEPLHEIGVETISFHPETCYHVHRLLQRIRSLGMKAGLALNPATPERSVLPVLSALDFILVMSVNPGYGGQQFLPLAVSKIRTLRRLIRDAGLHVEIEADGGINAGNADTVCHAGADILVVGSYIFAAEDIQVPFKELRQCLES